MERGERRESFVWPSRCGIANLRNLDHPFVGLIIMACFVFGLFAPSVRISRSLGLCVLSRIRMSIKYPQRVYAETQHSLFPHVFLTYIVYACVNCVPYAPRIYFACRHRLSRVMRENEIRIHYRKKSRSKGGKRGGGVADESTRGRRSQSDGLWPRNNRPAPLN